MMTRNMTAVLLLILGLISVCTAPARAVLIDRGVYMPCSQYEALFVSAAHSDEDIEATISAASEVLAGV